MFTILYDDRMKIYYTLSLPRMGYKGLKFVKVRWVPGSMLATLPVWNPTAIPKTELVGWHNTDLFYVS